MKKTVKILIWLFIIIYPIQSLYASTTSPFNKSVRLGNKYIIEKKFNQALPIWLNIVENNPSNYSACFKLGLCYFHMEEKQANAIPYFKKTLDHTTKDFNFYSTKEKQAL